MSTTPDQLRRPPITESPWFWLALFGGVGLLGVMVIGPKYAVRTARIERMQGTRERVAMERAQGTVAANAQTPPAETASAFEHEPYLPADNRPPLTLLWLAGIMIVLMFSGVGGLLVTRHRGPASLAPTSTSPLPDAQGAASL